MPKEEINVYFDKNIRDILKEKINQAEEVIYLAVAWLTDKELIDELIKKSEKGCKIRIIVSSDSKNFKLYRLGKLLGKVKLYVWVHFAYQINKLTKKEVSDKAFYLKSMHHKFCIIDEKILITGSANWSSNIDSNKENILVLNNKTIINQYLNEFNFLTNKSNKAKKKSLPSSKRLRKLDKEYDVQFITRVKSEKKFQRFARLKETEIKRIQNSIHKEYKKKKSRKNKCKR